MPSFTVFKGSKTGVVKATTTKPDLTGDQCFIRVTASGVCGTDIHYHNTDMTLGHEGVGVIEAVGPEVRMLKKGDRVGWGYQHNSCGLCDQCLSGNDTFCAQRELYSEANLDQGSFAEGAVWREAFLFKVPDALSDEDAAPLMCGGATVFTALHQYKIEPTMQVGVIGVGGLGHLAIQFAAKMGCEVTVFSGTDSKKAEAMELGARRFIATTGKTASDLEAEIGEKTLDCLIITTSVTMDWSVYVPILTPGATIFPLTVTFGDFAFPQLAMISSGLRIQGSIVANRWVHRRMLEFAARHGIKPMINKFTLSTEGIETAFKTLNDGKMRYRGVLIPVKN